MKRIVYLTSVLFVLSNYAHAQNITQHVPQGFNSLRADIAHGNTDSVYYESTTVGTKRRAIIYTPPGYSNDKGTHSGTR